MDARQSSRGRRISKQQEKRTAADLGGRTQAASGATRLGGGADVRLQGAYRVECKVTEKVNYNIKKAELLKLSEQAIKTLEIPVFQFAFRSKLGRLDRYAIIAPIYTYSKGHKDPFYHLDTHKKSVTITREYLQTCLSKERILLTFREGAWGRQWEIVTWDRFLESVNA